MHLTMLFNWSDRQALNVENTYFMIFIQNKKNRHCQLCINLIDLLYFSWIRITGYSSLVIISFIYYKNVSVIKRLPEDIFFRFTRALQLWASKGYYYFSFFLSFSLSLSWLFHSLYGFLFQLKAIFHKPISTYLYLLLKNYKPLTCLASMANCVSGKGES